MWTGDYKFVLRKLIVKDFKIRYRNMSLGAFWSLLNPIVMMSVLSFVFTKIFTAPVPHYAAFLLCGIVPYNFFVLAWSAGTGSVTESSSLIKRVPVPREIVPIASVLSNCLHLVIQIALLLALVLFSGAGVNLYWLWMVPNTHGRLCATPCGSLSIFTENSTGCTSLILSRSKGPSFRIFLGR